MIYITVCVSLQSFYKDGYKRIERNNMEKTKLHGWLVVNQFLHANKYNELYDWFQKAGELNGVQLTLKTNAELLVAELEQLRDEEKVDFVLFWDKDIRLAQMLENMGLSLYNSSKSIEMCDDKGYTYLALHKANIPMPKTILAPKTYEAPRYNELGFLTKVEEQLDYPFVVKECYGSFGWQVYLARNREDVVSLLEKTAPKPLLFQEYIEESSGKDIRLQVVGNEVVASMYRYSDNGDFRANLTIGGKMKAYEPSEEEKKLAIDCCKALNLDFGGVDLLFGEGGTPLVCEVNSNAHFRNIYDCTNVNVANIIIAYIKKRQLERSES